MDCSHEVSITYDKTVYKDALVHVELARCDTCGATGVVYKIWNEDVLEYCIETESWHDHGDAIRKMCNASIEIAREHNLALRNEILENEI